MDTKYPVKGQSDPPIKHLLRRAGDAKLAVDDPELLVKWWESVERRCRYCGLSEEALLRLALSDRFNRPVLRLTVILVNSNRGVVATNLALACERCSAFREVCSDAEAMKLGSVLAGVWRARLEQI